MAEITHRGPSAKTEPDTDADEPTERELPASKTPDDRARARAQAAEYLY